MTLLMSQFYARKHSPNQSWQMGQQMSGQLGDLGRAIRPPAGFGVFKTQLMATDFHHFQGA